MVQQVWQLDLKENADPAPGGKQAIDFVQASKDSREAYKRDFHRQLFGDQPITEHPLPDQQHQVVERDTGDVKWVSTFSKPKAQPVESNLSNDELVDKVVARIKSRGARGILGLGRSFQIMDKDKSGSLCFDEMCRAMKDYHISHDEAQIKTIFTLFDIDGSGRISYNEFLRTVVGEMNAYRKDLAEQAFRKMDLNGNGTIDLTDVKRRYSAKSHPDV